MRVIARRSLPVRVGSEVLQLVATQEYDLPEDVALALIRGMAASRVPDAAGAEPSQPTVATTPAQAAAPAPIAKPNRKRK